MEFSGTWGNLIKALGNAFPKDKLDFLVVSADWLNRELGYYNNEPILRKRNEQYERVRNDFIYRCHDMVANSYPLANLLTGKQNKFLINRKTK